MSWVQLSSRQPVARKEHRCEWCTEPIIVGEKHEHYTGVYDGDFQSTRMHFECLEASQRETAANDYWDNEMCPERHSVAIAFILGCFSEIRSRQRQREQDAWREEFALRMALTSQNLADSLDRLKAAEIKLREVLEVSAAEEVE